MDWMTLLAVNAAILAAAMSSLWLYCLRIKDVSVIDSFWSFGMVMLGATSFAMIGDEGPRSIALFALTAIWGLRLSFHLFTRWRAHGVDPRYAAMLGSLMDKRGMSFARASFVHVFLVQYALLFIVCLPAQLGQMPGLSSDLSSINWLGVALAITGIGFETIADAQLTQFRNNPANKGQVLNTGLWRYTRHPNYFGDACTWWGLWLIALGAPLGLFTVLGPVLITYLLTRVSGVPILEHRLKKYRPGYEDYLRRTSSFFPWPPKKD